MALGQPQRLDAALAVGLLVVAEDDGEGDGASFGGFELRLHFGFELVGELGLFFLPGVSLVLGRGGRGKGKLGVEGGADFDTGVP